MRKGFIPFLVIRDLKLCKIYDGDVNRKCNNFTLGFRAFKVYLARGWVDFTYNVWNEISNEQNPKVKLFTLRVDVAVVDFAKLKVPITILHSPLM